MNIPACFTVPECAQTDWSAHNESSRTLWRSFHQGTHRRTPARFNTNPRMILLDPRYNPEGVSYRQYFEDAATMTSGILAWHYWQRHWLPGDHEKGLPDAWRLWFDIENTYDATYFGCAIAYRDGQVPDTALAMDPASKHAFLDRALPDPMAGEWPQRCLERYADWAALRQSGFEWRGRPLGDPLPPSYIGTDGIFTAAVALYGASELCEDMLENPKYVHALLAYIYQALRIRMRAWRDHFGIAIPRDNFALADDAIQLLSADQYREFVLPWHQKLYDEFATPSGRTMHLCGHAQRHFQILRDTCGVTAFDTGFPIDFTAIRRDLGPDVLIYGGPRVVHFLENDRAALIAEVERIAQSGVLAGGRFVFQEANNLPPTARLDLCEAFYEAVQTHGAIPCI